jgi:hypothetical protein
MIKVIRMTSVDDDVAIEVLTQLPEETSVRSIYDMIKGHATLNANNIQKSLVEMSENDQGLPHASIYHQNNVIEQQIFASR